MPPIAKLPLPKSPIPAANPARAAVPVKLPGAGAPSVSPALGKVSPPQTPAGISPGAVGPKSVAPQALGASAPAMAPGAPPGMAQNLKTGLLGAGLQANPTANLLGTGQPNPTARQNAFTLSNGGAVSQMGSPFRHGPQIGNVAGLTPAGQEKLDSGHEAATAPPEDTRADWEKMYDDLLSAHDADAEKERGEIERNGQLALHNSQRGADILNARLGRSIAGGYAGLQAQATVGGMESIRKALAEQSLRSGDKRRGILMDRLNTSLNERHRSEDFQHDLDMLAAQQEPVPGLGPSVETMNHYDSQKAAINKQLSADEQAEYNELVSKWKSGELTGSEMKQWLDDHGVEYTDRAEQHADENKDLNAKKREMMKRLGTA